MRLLKLRLIPIVTLAAAALFVLKVSGLLLDRGYALIASRTASAQGIAMPPVVDLDAQGPAAAPPTITVTTTAKRGDRKPSPNPPAPPAPSEMAPTAEITGSVSAAKSETPAGPPPPTKIVQAPDQPPLVDLGKPAMTAGERAVLESLVQRRQELEARAREIEVRENLLKAAEQRIEQRMQELQEAEARLNVAMKRRDEGEVTKFKNLVSMYENMKAKDAAKVFDRLDMRVLIEVVGLMNPRRMSDILALMSPEAAEKLTIEIASRSGPDRGGQPAELPKIDGNKPSKS